MLLDPRNGPDWDHEPQPNAQTYVLASMPRSGSTLLARTLWDAGLGAPKEYFNPMQLRDWEVRLGTRASQFRHRCLRGRAVGLAGRGWWPPARVEAHLERLRLRRTAGGWFGLKIHGHHFERFFPDPDLLGPVTWLRIRRADRIAQAASWEHAVQSNRWIASQPRGTATYSRALLTRRLRLLEAHEARWDAFFADRPCTGVVYEALIADPTRELTRVFGALQANVVPPPLPLQPQGDAAAWADRYRRGR